MRRESLQRSTVWPGDFDQVQVNGPKNLEKTVFLRCGICSCSEARASPCPFLSLETACRLGSGAGGSVRWAAVVCLRTGRDSCETGRFSALNPECSC